MREMIKNTGVDASVAATSVSSALDFMTKNAKNLKLYGLDTCQSIDFRTNSVFYGAVYAPNADIRLHNSVEVFGSVIGNSFTQDVNANFHYDASLRQASVSDEVVHFVVDWWSEE